MLKRFNEFKHLCIECKDFEQLTMIRELLIQEKFREIPNVVPLAKCRVVGVFLDENKFCCSEYYDVKRIDGTSGKLNHVLISFENVINVEMKKQYYLSNEMIKCINYVEDVFEAVRVVDLIPLGNHIIVKYENPSTDRNGEYKLEDYFEKIIYEYIETDFVELMNCDYDSLDEQYQMLKLARKIAREFD